VYTYNSKEVPAMAFVITSPCIGEKAADCVSTCPVDCIHEGEDQYYIDPDTCIECGACETVCPVVAIFHENDVPDFDTSFIQKNADFFKK
jgi:NAD-dependent dihydropyrimidine dehydrogenase PreA subunit